MIRKAVERILEALYPTRAKCLGCGDEQGCDEPFLCDACRKLLRPVNVVAKKDEWKDGGLEWAAFAYYYERPIKGLIRSYKFKNVRMLAESMGRDLVDLIELRNLGPFDMVIPVPLHPKRLRERGFNQAELLALPLKADCGFELRTDILQRIRKTKQQSRLGISQRGANLLAAFSAGQDLTGKSILLVDDVVTTGSTLCSCAQALKDAGASHIAAVALAGSHAWRRGRKRMYRLKKK